MVSDFFLSKSDIIKKYPFLETKNIVVFISLDGVVDVNFQMLIHKAFPSFEEKYHSMILNQKVKKGYAILEKLENNIILGIPVQNSMNQGVEEDFLKIAKDKISSVDKKFNEEDFISVIPFFDNQEKIKSFFTNKENNKINLNIVKI